MGLLLLPSTKNKTRRSRVRFGVAASIAAITILLLALSPAIHSYNAEAATGTRSVVLPDWLETTWDKIFMYTAYDKLGVCKFKSELLFKQCFDPMSSFSLADRRCGCVLASVGASMLTVATVLGVILFLEVAAFYIKQLF